MAFAETVTVSPANPTIGTGSDKSFVTIRRGAQETERLNSATDLSLPEKLSIKHQQTGGKSGVITDRHLAQFTLTQADSAGVQHTCTVNLTIAVPRNGLFSTAEVEDLVAQMANFIFGSGNLAALLQNQS